MATKTGYLIDPAANRVRPVEFDTLDSIYNLLECRCFGVVVLDNGDAIYIDDEGLLRQPEWYFRHSAYRTDGFLAGKGLIVGPTDDNGYTSSKPFGTLAYHRKRVTALDVHTVRTIFALRRELSDPRRATEDLDRAVHTIVNDTGEGEVGGDPTCPTCGGPPTLLGPLGPSTWYRCRDCGEEYGETTKGIEFPEITNQ
jgi:hypothetical protein